LCKELLVIPVNRMVDKKIIIGKNAGPRKRKGTRDPFVTSPLAPSGELDPQG
jgi:hypothetical protein